MCYSMTEYCMTYYKDVRQITRGRRRIQLVNDLLEMNYLDLKKAAEDRSILSKPSSSIQLGITDELKTSKISKKIWEICWTSKVGDPAQ